MTSGRKRVAIAAAVAAVSYPLAYLFWLAAFSPPDSKAVIPGLLIFVADIPFAIAGATWLPLQVSNPTAIRWAESFLTFDAQYPVPGWLVVLACAIALIVGSTMMAVAVRWLQAA